VDEGTGGEKIIGNKRKRSTLPEGMPKSLVGTLELTSCDENKGKMMVLENCA
jgi:hypothetical protein